MPPPWIHYSSFSALPEYCEPSSPLLAKISSVLHICLPTPLALLSSTLGTVSILSWLFAQLPQIYKNYVIQSTSGLSALFVVEWCLGDSANLIGAILTDQAGWQIIIAAYYVFVDVVLVFQYFWYTHLKSRGLPQFNDNEGSISGNGDDWEGVFHRQSGTSNPPSPHHCAPPSEPKGAPDQGYESTGTSHSGSSFLSNEKQGSSSRTILRAGSSASGPAFVSPKAVLFVSMLCAVMANASAPTNNGSTVHSAQPPPESAGQIAGRVSSWTSAVMYLASRMPQLYKNYRRKSTAGLSPLLFCAAFCGNLFYSTSLLTNPNAWSDFPPHGGGGWAGPQGSDRLEWVGRAIPFFLGAAGVLILDGAVGLQFLIYAEKDEDAVVKVKSLGRGRGRWKRVTGWMRGWIPSVSPGRTVPGEETRPLLTQMQDRYGGV